MIRLLIVDDEPLVCVGLQSMLDWAAYDIEVVGTARNGQQAIEMIEAEMPDIVISDIKMPVMGGLELVRESASRFGRLPLFLLLTSYEEFDYVREAMRLGAVDYLIKIELDADTLAKALIKAIEALHAIKKQNAPAQAPQPSNKQALREKFFIRLLNNLFDSDAERLSQMQGLGISLGDGPLAVVSFTIDETEGRLGDDDKVFARFSSALQLARETLVRYFPCCHIVTLDIWYFSAVLGGVPNAEDPAAYAHEAVAHTIRLLHNYLSISTRAGIGHHVSDPGALAASYQASQRCLHSATKDVPVQTSGALLPAQGETADAAREILLGVRRALEEMDAEELDLHLNRLAGLLSMQPNDFLAAMDTACNILYMAISLLPEGEAALGQIFSAFPDGYRSLHRMRQVRDISVWLDHFRRGCGEYLATQHRSYKKQVIESVKRYIDDNIDKRLSLQEVADVFNFSPNYLSQLFARHTGEGFVDYITARKVRIAKDMLRRGDGRIYEIAERLGFDSSFYFSKVFKKVEGVSPREYQQRLAGKDDAD